MSSGSKDSSAVCVTFAFSLPLLFPISVSHILPVFYTTYLFLPFSLNNLIEHYQLNTFSPEIKVKKPDKLNNVCDK